MLAGVGFQPCGSLSESSSGWEPPATGYDALARRVGGADLFRLRVQSRLLPAAAVSEALDERVAEFRERHGTEPSRRERRDLREDVYSALLPQALLKSDRIHGFTLPREKLLGVDTASANQAEQFLDRLRDAFGSLQVAPLSFKTPFAALMDRVFLGRGPTELVAGRECRMVDSGAGRASVTWLDMDVTEPSVRRHVAEGLTIDRLAMSYHEALAFTLDRDGVLRKVRLPTGDVADELPDEDPLARLDAEFTVFSATVRRLVAMWRKELDGYA